MRRWIFLPTAVFLLAVMIFFENINIRKAVSPGEYISAFKEAGRAQAADISGLRERTALVLRGNGAMAETAAQNMAETLSYMKVKSKTLDVDEWEPSLPMEDYDLVIFSANTMRGSGELLDAVFEYAQQGGRVFFSGGLSIDSVFLGFYQSLGIREVDSTNNYVHQISFAPGFSPFDPSPEMLSCAYVQNDAHPLQLESSFTAHIYAETENGRYPILWSGALGQGKIMVCSATVFEEKTNRGILALAIGELMEAWIYPVINAMVLFIDDFPAPLPEGYNPIITAEYDMNIESFYRDVWWPDMQELAQRHKLIYTGLLVETYSDVTVPPFEPNSDSELQRKFARTLTETGGELGLHGYNHMSLLPPDFYDDSDREPLYEPWTSPDYMAQSISELLEYGRTLLGEYDFVSYVPPSNLISEEGIEALIRAAPQIFVIAGLYSGVPDDLEYISEICVDPRGFVNLPRLTSGMELDANELWCMFNGMLMHGLVSHFIHPDDILDPERGKGQSWSEMRDKFEFAMEYARVNMPSCRPLTATQAAIEVKKQDEIRIYTGQTDKKLTVGIENFSDEVDFMLRLPAAPGETPGCEIEHIGGNFYVVHARSANFSIVW